MTQRWRAPARRIGVVALCWTAPAALLASPADAAPASTRVHLTGTVLVAPAEARGTAASFAVQADDGSLVEVRGLAAGEAQAGMRFTGTVALPSRLGSGTSALDAALGAGEPAQVLTHELTAPAPAVTGAVHHWYAAAPDNFGALDQGDAALLDQIGQMATYWESQADGAIADVVPPSAVVRYPATATTTAAGCGLVGGDFWTTVGEAAALFPDADFGGGDQLLLLMPSSCVTGGVVGRGSVGGLSFANGGYTINRHSASIFKQTLAHELGHNYGYGHARMGPCTTSCASEYGDYFSLMGAVVTGYPQPTALSTPYRLLQGITEAGEVETLQSGDTPTTVTRTLAPRSAASGLRSVAFIDPSTGHTLYADFRSGTGADAGTYYAAGTAASSFRPGVVVEEVYNGSGIALLPDGSTKALVAGQSRSFAGGAVTLTVTSLSASGATVEVTLPGLPAYPTPGSVSVSGVARVGSTLTASLSGQSPAPTGVGYQWLADGSPIAGATTSWFVPGPQQAGAAVSVAATVSTPGYAPATITSAAQLVAPGTLTVAEPPVVTGTAQVGTAVTCAPPVVSPDPAGLTLTVSWRRSGQPIDAATGSAYTPVAADRGTSLSCHVVASAPGFVTAATDSAEVLVRAGRLSTSRPTLSGRPRVGRVLRAHPGEWTDGTLLRFRWYADGVRVRGAHDPQLRLTTALRGARLRVRVIGTLEGYHQAARQSARTRPIR